MEGQWETVCLLSILTRSAGCSSSLPGGGRVPGTGTQSIESHQTGSFLLFCLLVELLVSCEQHLDFINRRRNTHAERDSPNLAWLESLTLLLPVMVAVMRRVAFAFWKSSVCAPSGDTEVFPKPQVSASAAAADESAAEGAFLQSRGWDLMVASGTLRCFLIIQVVDPGFLEPLSVLPLTCRATPGVRFASRLNVWKEFHVRPFAR